MAVNKEQFIDRMAENGHVTKKSCREYFDLMWETLLELLQEGEIVKFCGIMRAEIKTAPERPARNPQTGEKHIVPEHKRIKVRISEKLLKDLNEKGEDTDIDG